MAQNLPATDQLFGATVVDSDGDKIGKVDEVYLDNESGQPEWVSVKTGLFGSNVALIPLAEASFSGETMTVPFDKAKVKDAPHHDPAAELSESDEDDLYRYYGVGNGGTDTTTTGTTTTDSTRTETTGTGTAGMTAGDRTGGDLTTAGRTDRDVTDMSGTERTSTDRTSTDRTGTDRDVTGTATSGAGHDTSGPDTDGAMTRSKEELRVGTETREAGRARLRKYITSETVERQVPVSHEEVVVKREPITDANRGDALRGGDLTEEEHEVVLTEERAVAAKETVPVERVQLGTETVTGTETVSAEVREEQIDLDADNGVKHSTRDRD